MNRLLVTLVLLSSATLLTAQTEPDQSDQEKIESLQKKVDELDQRLRVDERRKEIEDEAAAGARNPSLTFGSGGVLIRSADENLQLRIGLDLQIDGRFYPMGLLAPATDGFLIRRARPAISGTAFKYIDFYLRPDFGQGQVVLYESYIDLKYFSRFVVRAGKFKPPVGLERLQSDDDTNFIERGLPTLLVPSRDIGYQVSGDIIKRRVNYAVGVFNGVADNSLSDAGTSSHKEYDGRLFFTPFNGAGPGESKNPLTGLGFGIAATGGSMDGLPLPSYKTLGQVTFFNFASGVTSAGHRTRLAPQANYYLGPFGVLAEFTKSEEGYQKGNVRRPIAFRSWQVQASYLLTGEKKGFTSPTPKKSVDPLHGGGWGAVELAIRVGDFEVEHGIYDYGFASLTNSPRRAHEWMGAISWYLNRNLRLELNGGNTNFAGGAAISAATPNGNRPSEKTILSRFQVNF